MLKRTFILICLVLSFCSLPAQELIQITTRNTALVFRVANQSLRQVYYGPRLADTDVLQKQGNNFPAYSSLRIAITTPTNYNSPQLRHRGLPYSPKNRIQPAHPIQTASALPALWQTSSSFYCTPLYYPAWPGSPTHKPYKGYLCRFSV